MGSPFETNIPTPADRRAASAVVATQGAFFGSGALRWHELHETKASVEGRMLCGRPAGCLQGCSNARPKLVDREGQTDTTVDRCSPAPRRVRLWLRAWFVFLVTVEGTPRACDDATQRRSARLVFPSTPFAPRKTGASPELEGGPLPHACLRRPTWCPRYGRYLVPQPLSSSPAGGRIEQRAGGVCPAGNGRDQVGQCYDIHVTGMPREAQCKFRLRFPDRSTCSGSRSGGLGS